MLLILRLVFGIDTDSFCLYLTDTLVGYFTLVTDKLNLFECMNRLLERHDSVLVELHALGIVNRLLQMTHASEHARVYSLLVLRDRTLLRLIRVTVRVFFNLLKLIQTDRHADVLLFGDRLSKS